MTFVNATLGYYVDAGEAGAGNGGVFTFNPTSFNASKVGGRKILYSPTSVAVGGSGVWVTQHGASSLQLYNLKDRTWTTYPTSTVAYQISTLPYFVRTNGSLVWFNEHYGNKIAMLDTDSQILTEFSVSNPPATNGSQIDNVLTIALGKDRVWFTGWTANYVGFVDASFEPDFSISILGKPVLHVQSGRAVNLTLAVTGSSANPLSIELSDSELYTSKPVNIMMDAKPNNIESLSGQIMIPIDIVTAASLKPGGYTLLITVTDGLVYRSVYVTLSVS